MYIKAKKSLGQNFLIDRNVLEEIVNTTSITNKEILEIGFQVAKKLNLQSVAFDFVIDNGEPKIIELSYGFGTLGSSKCEGYWDDKYQWHHSKFNPFGWMIENLLHNK